MKVRRDSLSVRLSGFSSLVLASLLWLNGAVAEGAQELPPGASATQEAPGGQGETPPSPTEGVPVEPEVRDVPTPPPVAILGATVHSMLPGSVPRVADVWIENRRIRAIGEGLAIPPGVETIDGTGKHLVPGLVDGMVSFDPNHDLLYLSHGITTVRDMGSIPRLLQVIREPGNREINPGPLVISAGAVLDGSPASSPSAVGIADENELIAAVNALANDVGAEFLSIQPRFPAELLSALGEQARGAGLPIWALLATEVEMGAALEAGIRGFLGMDVLLPQGIDWGVIQPIALRMRVKELAQAGGAIIPVVSQAQRNLRVEDPESDELELLDFFYVSQWMGEWRRREAALSEDFLKLGERIGKKRRTVLMDLLSSEASVVPGSGAPLSWVMPGRSLIDELDVWVQAGAAPIDVLDHATRRACEEFRLGGRGIVEVEAVADLVLIDVDPRLSLDGLRDPAAILVRGNLLERVDLTDRLRALAREHNLVKSERARPVEIAPPEMPEGAPVMAGQVETWDAYGNRLASERFAIVREVDGALSVVGRMVQPVAAGQPETQVEIAQRIVDGRLQGFVVRLMQGENSLVARGVDVGGTMRVERRLNGQHVATQSTEQGLLLWALDPLVDSVTSALVLGQVEDPGEHVVFMAGAQLEPVLDIWAVLDDEDGARWVRFADGYMAIEFDERGFPQRVSRRFGAGEANANQAVTISTLVEGSERTFGGPGWRAQTVYVPAVDPAEASAPGAEGAPAPGVQGAPDAGIPGSGEPNSDTAPPDDSSELEGSSTGGAAENSQQGAGVGVGGGR